MKNLFVGNLDFHVVEDDLRELFGRYGQIDRITLMKERDTGRSRGFAFVEMTNTDDADKAIKDLDGGQFVGRTLRVNAARPRAERSEGNRGYARGRRRA